MQYVEGDKEPKCCVFCHALDLPVDSESLIIDRGKSAFVLLNRFPYTTGHLMVVPYQHIQSLDLLDVETRGELIEITSHALEVLRQVYKPDGFNVGVNIGSAAGAGVVGHVHIHIVARWAGDTNFMSTLGETRVLPEDLAKTYQRLRAAW
jgi:ATP adenylyltransferase